MQGSEQGRAVLNRPATFSIPLECEFSCTFNLVCFLFFVYEKYMKIIYDENKRLVNIEKHGLDFADLTIDFFADALIVGAKQGRYMAIGEFQGIVVIAVVFRPLGSEALSVISMRLASTTERKHRWT